MFGPYRLPIVREVLLIDMLIIIKRPSGSVMVVLWINDIDLLIKIQTPVCFLLKCDETE